MLRAITAPFRKRSAPGVVLLYHRIANTLTDTWKLAVSPENFEEHLKVLKDYNIISIKKLETILTTKLQILPKTVLITFDDGYRDNYVIAKSLLEKYRIPATFFITTNAIGKQKEFWWDALERICLQSPALPSKLILEQPEEITLEIGNSTKAHILSPLDLYLRLCELIRKMKPAQKEIFVKKMEDWSENSHARTEYFTMDDKELLDMQSNELFTIGAHTMSHPFLPDLTYKEQKEEIDASVDYLKKLCGLAPKYFAYPHGGRDQNTSEILAHSGLELAFTTDPQVFKTNTYKYDIPRYQVSNWDGETFAYHLDHWTRSNIISVDE